MSRVYDRSWSVANGDELEVDSGTYSACFTLTFPPEALIRKIVLRQASGTSVGGTLTLYNKPVCQADAGSSPAAVDAAEVLAKVTPSIAFNAGEPLEVFSATGYVFRNSVGTYTVPVQRIYAQIEFDNETVDASTWELAIGCVPELNK